jgi:hypothetical protein
MSMKRIFGFGLLATMAAAGAAFAGQQARFHLPVGARWGAVTLEPGDYQVSLPETTLGNPQFILTADNRSRYILPLATEYDAGRTGGSGQSYLQLVKVDGSYFVSKYRSGTGKVFSFAVPKHEKHKLEMTDRDVVQLGVSGN